MAVCQDWRYIVLMPKITEERREERRLQILNAAWRCFFRYGVQVTSMEQIIAESGQSASAMYRYFKGKDDIILAAITSSLGDLVPRLAPVIAQASGPAALVETICSAIDRFCVRDGFDLRVIAVQGWAEAQTVPAVRDVIARFYIGFRQTLAGRIKSWDAACDLTPAQADAAAQALQSLILGYVLQTTLVGAAPQEQAEGLAVLGRYR